jgi:hypothetical protein
VTWELSNAWKLEVDARPLHSKLASVSSSLMAGEMGGRGCVSKKGVIIWWEGEDSPVLLM